MLQGALEYYANLAQRANSTEVLWKTDRKMVVVRADGSIGNVDLPIPPRTSEVSSLASLAQASELYGQLEGSSIWVSGQRIVLVCNDGSPDVGFMYRDETVSMSITMHPAFAALGREEWRTQKQMVDFFRHTLADCTIDPSNVKESIKSLKWTTHDETTGNFSATSSSMGKSIQAEVSGAVALPEIVTVEFHPYPGLADEVDVNVVITCTLFTDVENAKLKLSPQPGQLEHAARIAREAVAKAIRELVGETPVFLGTP